MEISQEDDDDDNTLKFEHPKWKSNLVENLRILLLKGELCDLYIVCHDQRDVAVSLPCHSCILASASPVIRNMLMKNDIFAAWTKLSVKSAGISAKEWQYILQYVYTGSVNIHEPHIYAVWKAALYLQIDVLVTVLATCIHNYHHSSSSERYVIPELKICPFNPNVLIGGGKKPGQTQSIIDRKSATIEPTIISDGFITSPTTTPGDETIVKHKHTSENVNKQSSTLCHNVGHVSRHMLLETSQSKNTVNSNEQKQYRDTIEKSFTSKNSINEERDIVDLTGPKPTGVYNYDPPANKKRKMYTPRKVSACDSKKKDSDDYIVIGQLRQVSDETSNCIEPNSNQTASSASYSLGKSKPSKTDDYQTDALNLTCPLAIKTEFPEISSEQGWIDNNRSGDTDSQALTYSRQGLSTPTSISFQKPLIIAPIPNVSALNTKTLINPVEAFNSTDLFLKKESPSYSWGKWNRSCEQDSLPGEKSDVASKKSLLLDLLHGQKDTSPVQKTSNNVFNENQNPIKESSSVLKSLLVSSTYSYRPSEIPVTESDPVTQLYFKDSSEDEDYDYLIDYESVNNKKRDPDYRPKCTKGKSQNAALKLRDQIISSSSRKISIAQHSPDTNVSVRPLKHNEPYSASSILLSMIKDAGAKKSSTNVLSQANNLTSLSDNSVSVSAMTRHDPVPTKQSILTNLHQKGDGATISTNTKGILRNLLKEKGTNPGKGTESEKSNNEPADAGLSNADLSSMQKSATSTSENRKEEQSDGNEPGYPLPFSNVLKNMASAYNSSSAGMLLKKILSDSSPEEELLIKKLRQTSSNKTLPVKGYKSDESSHTQNLQSTINNEGQESPTIQKSHLKDELSDNSMPFLKLTICKTGEDFKIKEEKLSPKVVFVESLSQEGKSVPSPDDSAADNDMLFQRNNNTISNVGDRSVEDNIKVQNQYTEDPNMETECVLNDNEFAVNECEDKVEESKKQHPSLGESLNSSNNSTCVGDTLAMMLTQDINPYTQDYQFKIKNTNACTEGIYSKDENCDTIITVDSEESVFHCLHVDNSNLSNSKLRDNSLSSSGQISSVQRSLDTNVSLRSLNDNELYCQENNQSSSSNSPVSISAMLQHDPVHENIVSSPERLQVCESVETSHEKLFELGSLQQNGSPRQSTDDDECKHNSNTNSNIGHETTVENTRNNVDGKGFNLENQSKGGQDNNFLKCDRVEEKGKSQIINSFSNLVEKTDYIKQEDNISSDDIAESSKLSLMKCMGENVKENTSNAHTVSHHTNTQKREEKSFEHNDSKCDDYVLGFSHLRSLPGLNSNNRNTNLTLLEEGLPNQHSNKTSSSFSHSPSVSDQNNSPKNIIGSYQQQISDNHSVSCHSNSRDDASEDEGGDLALLLAGRNAALNFVDASAEFDNLPVFSGNIEDTQNMIMPDDNDNPQNHGSDLEISLNSLVPDVQDDNSSDSGTSVSDTEV